MAPVPFFFLFFLFFLFLLHFDIICHLLLYRRMATQKLPVFGKSPISYTSAAPGFENNAVRSNTSASNIRKLQGVKNFAARIVSGTRKFDHVTPALKNLRWIPVKSHLYLRDAILAFKSMTGQVPNYLRSNFISRGNISGRATRSSTQLNIPLFKTTSGQKSFYYRTVTLWNALKPYFQLSDSLTI